MKKKILFLASKECAKNPKKRIHYGWVRECSEVYDIEFWGPGYSDVNLKSLKKRIGSFKPDYIYITHRNRCRKWLPDTSSIKNIPKIFVEVDSYKLPRTDPWYSQFHKIYCRQPIWDFRISKELDENYFCDMYKTILEAKKAAKKDKEIIKEGNRLYKKYVRRVIYAKTWNKTPLFRWSIPESSIYLGGKDRHGIYFIGRSALRLSNERFDICTKLKDKIIPAAEWNETKYNKLLRSASALICPTSSTYGDYVPAKIYEFASSGAAIITNCNLKQYEMADLDKVVVKYSYLDDLEEKFSLDFTKYHNLAAEVMLNHTDKKRYGELFK